MRHCATSDRTDSFVEAGQGTLTLSVIRAGAAVLTVLLTACTLTSAMQSDPRVQGDLQSAALARIRKDSTRAPTFRFSDGIPQLVEVRIPLPRNAHDDPVGMAIAFLTEYRDLYGLHDPVAELYPGRIVADESGQHVFLRQRRDQVSVFASEIVVHLEDNAVIATNRSFLREIPPVTRPTISAERAKRIAISDGGPGRMVGLPKLIYFNPSLFMTEASLAAHGLEAHTSQAWQISVQNGDGAWKYFVDSQSGRVLFRLDLRPSHAPQKQLRIRSAGGTLAFICSYGSATEWFDQNGLKAGASPDTEGMSAFSSVNKIYDYFYATLHRHSWNGSDGDINVILGDGTTPPGAFFNGLCHHFVFSPGYSRLNIIAHEVTHVSYHRLSASLEPTKPAH